MHLIAAGRLPWILEPANWWLIFQVAAGLGFVIFVHELGHFLVAKACGVKCEKFYLGFDIGGLKLLKFQWGETEYGIGILPLGGYVKMLGQDDNPARMAEEVRRATVQAGGEIANTAAPKGYPASSGTPAPERGSPKGISSLGWPETTIVSAEHAPVLTHGDLPPEPVSDAHAPYDPRSYMAQSVPKRMAIISAGVIMNVIFAFIMAAVAYRLGVKEAPCIVRGVVPGGAAWKADLQPGDIVTQIGKTKNPRFRDLREGVTLGDIQNGLAFEILRPAEQRSFKVTLHPDRSLGVPMIGIIGPWTLKLNAKLPTVPHSPARQAKPPLEGGDLVVKVNGTVVDSLLTWSRLIAASYDKLLQVTVLREVKGPAAAAVEKAAVEGENGERGVPQEEITITVAPTPVRDLGLIMAMGPVSSVQDGSPAAQAGIQAGDRIVLVNGQPVGNPLTLPERMRRIAAAGRSVRIGVQREVDGKPQRLSLEVTPRVPALAADVLLPTGPMSAPALGIAYKVYSKVEGVVAGSPAAKAEIKPGDEVLKATITGPKEQQQADNQQSEDDEPGAPITIKFAEKDPAWPYLVFEVLPFVDPKASIELELKRPDQKREVTLGSAVLKDETGNVIYTPERGFLFEPLEITRVAKSLAEALQLGGRETVEDLLLVYRFLQKVGQQQISVKMLGGPVEIFRQASYSAKEGLSKFLLFLTLLSANLAVVNFLPIPLLDGGHMVFLLYELIRGKPASERVIITFTYFGLIFLLSLMAFLLALDLGFISRR